ncbi:hypothetical protein CIL05_13425 [Virgibacillus profundi]|uniref:PPM-type phosphatase domain-containing protein n=1 Tax=Virgibacillus profundi TaxID=2024555 RepID=A0A2A2ICE5_9BACI|nr:PP2C family serine/threonine-protein phosphatase [Virgibacillus profundi]PAV28976.1 hypothetical protein CIL05_13425 [Virgibacillus profundi]PXY53144.1 serine/threonine-protein phosphatase [Virgibacillus profundi]
MSNMIKNEHVQTGSFSVKPSSKKANEDSLAYSANILKSDQGAYIFIIADGMGGHSMGDAASYFAVNYVLKWWRSTAWMNKRSEEFLKNCQEELIEVFHEINQKLIEIGRLENKEIGTTLSVLILIGNEYFICHIGDSRIYRYREKVLTLEEPNGDTIDLNEEKSFLQLTVDHSFASMQVENGVMTAEEAQSHDKAHYLTQCIGIKGEIEPFTASGKFTAADYFLLCTDGFYKLFTEEELKEQWSMKLEEKVSIKEVSDHFYDLVKKDSFHDDVSILTINVAERIGK